MPKGVDSKTKHNNAINDFIESQNHCVLCNTQLEIKVESYLEDYLLKEEAICPNCKIKMREKNHRMH